MPEVASMSSTPPLWKPIPLAELQKINPELAELLSLFPAGTDPRWVANLPVILKQMRKHPRHISHSDAHRKLATAIRLLEKHLPGLIADADVDAADARATARNTDSAMFAEKARALLAAAEPFHGITRHRKSTGWWHGYARMIALEVRLAFQSTGQSVSFNHNSRPLLLVQELLKRGGCINRDGDGTVSADALIDVLRMRDRMGN